MLFSQTNACKQNKYFYVKLFVNKTACKENIWYSILTFAHILFWNHIVIHNRLWIIFANNTTPFFLRSNRSLPWFINILGRKFGQFRNILFDVFSIFISLFTKRYRTVNSENTEALLWIFKVISTFFLENKSQNPCKLGIGRLRVSRRKKSGDNQLFWLGKNHATSQFLNQNFMHTT